MRGILAHSRSLQFDALEPIRKGARGYVGGFASDIARGLAVRHFGTIDELRQAPLTIRETYNTASMNEQPLLTPAGLHQEQLHSIGKAA